MVSRRTFILSGLSVAAVAATGYGLWPRLGGYTEFIERQRQLMSATPELVDLVRMATLAANGHNTQPWRFRLSDSSVSILPDFSRRTAVVDPDDHHLYVSLGCAAENLVIAAAASGRSAEVDIRNGSETTIDIALKSGAVNNVDELYQAIPHRQSTRSVYDGQALSSTEIELLKTAAEEEGVSVLFFTNEADREAILEFVVEGNSMQMDDPAFVKELKDWIRFSPDAALAVKDGLFSACSGNPVVPSWLGNRMFDSFFKKESENDKYRDQIRSSAGIAVFIADEEDPEHWIKVGRSFQRFALKATALGIRNAHVNMPIEVPSIRPEFANWLGLPNKRPDLIVRFGRAPALPRSLRRPVSEVII